MLLVGDEAYYGRFGFSTVKTATLALAGADPTRLLARELVPGALDGAHGRLLASGTRAPMPALATLRPLAGRRAPARPARRIIRLKIRGRRAAIRAAPIPLPLG